MSTNFALSPCNECGKLNRVAIVSAATPSARVAVCGSCKSVLPVREAVNELGAQALATLLRSSSYPVIVDFWAPWCGPCRSFAPTFKQAAADLAGQAVFVKINTEAEPQAGSTHGIRSIPTLIRFEGGMERDRVSGALPLAQLENWITQAKAS